MYKLVELRQSRRVQGLTPNFIPVSGENTMEYIDQGAATNSQVGENVVTESGDPYPSHGPPLAQQPSRGNISFHSPIEGHVDDTTHEYYGPNAPFWDTSMEQAVSSFCTRPTSSEEISTNEEEHRQY